MPVAEVEVDQLLLDRIAPFTVFSLQASSNLRDWEFLPQTWGCCPFAPVTFTDHVPPGVTAQARTASEDETKRVIAGFDKLQNQSLPGLGAGDVGKGAFAECVNGRDGVVVRLAADEVAVGIGCGRVKRRHKSVAICGPGAGPIHLVLDDARAGGLRPGKVDLSLAARLGEQVRGRRGR